MKITKATTDFAKMIMFFVISGVILYWCMSIIIKNQDDTQVKWACGTVGTILGYWVK